MADITKKEAERAVQKAERDRAKKRATKLELTELVTVGVVAGGRGYMKVKNPTIFAFGPSGRLSVDFFLLGGGLYLGFKKSGKTQAMGMGAAKAALAALAEEKGTQAAS